MHGVGVAEEIMEIAEDLLVGADQERAEVVGLVLPGVKRERPLHVPAVDELIDLAVGIAGHVAEDRIVRGPLAEPMDRHHRKELLDRPAVGHRLEEREVAEVGVGERGLEPLQFLRHELQLLRHLGDLPADRPVEVLHGRPLVERQVAAGKQVHRGVERLLRVVIALQQVADVDVLEGFHQVVQRLLGIGRRLDQLAVAPLLRHSQHAEDQHAVVGDHGPPALRNDRRVRNPRLIAGVLHVVDDVVGVFLQAVIHARLEVRLRAVVIHPQAAAHVEILEPRPPFHEFRVDPRSLVEGHLDVADVRDLAALVEMQQLQAVFHPLGGEQFEPFHQFARRQAELAAKAARRLPAAAAARGEFHPHADPRTHAELFRVFEHHVQLGKPLHDRDDMPADLLCEHRRLDELGILEAVADDGRVVVGQRDHGQQLRLAARFQPEAIRPAKPQHLLHHLPLLVDLHRIDAAVIAAVAVLLHGRREHPVDLPQAVLEDLGESQEDRQVDAANLQPIDELLEVDALGGVLVGVHQQVAGGAHRKIPVAPTGHLVEVGRIGRFPVFDIEICCCHRRPSQHAARERHQATASK